MEKKTKRRFEQHPISEILKKFCFFAYLLDRERFSFASDPPSFLPSRFFFLLML